MAISKVVYKSSANATPVTWMDATPATALAADIMAPKTAMLADGVLTTGTGSGGGGGGLEYETGTFTPSNDDSAVQVYFINAHTTAPAIYVIADVTQTASSTTADNLGELYANFEQIFGSGGAVSSSQTMYGLVGMRYKSSATGSTGTTNIITVPISNSDGSTSGQPTFWATNQRIFFNTNSNSRYARSGRTYKWIAIWFPST